MTDEAVGWPWSVLGVGEDASRADVKRAYARRLKVTHPEDDPDGFKALREAYETALSWAGAGQAVVFAVPVEPAAVDDRAVIAEGPAPVDPPLPAPTPAPARPAPPKSGRRTAVPAGPDPREALWAAQAALARLLRAADAADEDKRAALRAVTASPALENLALYADTEAWVASLLAHNSPVTDPLIDPAAEAFGWDLAAGRLGLPFDVAQVLQRRDALRHLETLRRKTNRHHATYRLLHRPLRGGPVGWLMMGLRREKVSQFLFLLDQAPGTEAGFDPEVLEGWRAFVGSRSGWAAAAVWRWLIWPLAVFIGVLVALAVLVAVAIVTDKPKPDGGGRAARMVETPAPPNAPPS